MTYRRGGQGGGVNYKLTHLHIVVPGTLHNKALHVLVGGEGGELEEPGDGQCLVYLGYLQFKIIMQLSFSV